MTRWFVLDASTALSWAFDDEGDAGAEVLDHLDEGVALVPSLWPYEVVNGLAVGLRKDRLTQEEAEAFLVDLMRLDIRVHDAPVDSATLLATAIDHRLTAYDASYLHLAKAQGIPLASDDRALRQAAREAEVELLDAAR